MKFGLIGYEANVSNRVGSNQYALELLIALSKLPAKHDFHIFLPSPALPELPAPSSTWHYHQAPPKRFWNYYGLPKALLANQPFDLIFNPGHYCPLISPAPLAISIMDLGYLHYPDQFTKPIYWKLKYWTAFSLTKAKHLFAISQSTKRDLMTYYHVPDVKITVTYPGYNAQKFGSTIKPSELSRVRQNYHLPDQYLLFLSTLKPSKNIEGLIRAFGQLHQSMPSLKLVIAGKQGWLYASISHLVSQLNLGQSVLFPGFIPDQDVPALMAGAQVFVLPSFWEGFGIPVVEAMASGVPVVVSNRGSLPEIVGQAGIIVDPDSQNSLVRGIIQAMDQRSLLIARGLVQAHNYSWSACARQTLTTLEGLVT